jgi:uncharacterized protein YbaR (Trm112 family)
VRPLPDELLEVLVCPRCRGPLAHRPEVPALDCEACRLRFRIEDGVPVLLLSEAVAAPRA